MSRVNRDLLGGTITGFTISIVSSNAPYMVGITIGTLTSFLFNKFLLWEILYATEGAGITPFPWILIGLTVGLTCGIANILLQSREITETKIRLKIFLLTGLNAITTSIILWAFSLIFYFPLGYLIRFFRNIFS